MSPPPRLESIYIFVTVMSGTRFQCSQYPSLNSWNPSICGSSLLFVLHFKDGRGVVVVGSGVVVVVGSDVVVVGSDVVVVGSDVVVVGSDVVVVGLDVVVVGSDVVVVGLDVVVVGSGVVVVVGSGVVVVGSDVVVVGSDVGAEKRDPTSLPTYVWYLELSLVWHQLNTSLWYFAASYLETIDGGAVW